MSQDTAQQNQTYSNYYYQHSNNNNYTHNTTMKYEHNKRTAAAVDDDRRPSPATSTFYENVFFTNDNDNNKRPKNLALERVENQNAPFKREQHFVSNTTSVSNDITSPSPSPSPIHYVKDKLVADYENFEFKRNLPTDKRVLLQKYFRTALVGPRTNIYENLCRGCNYGVFTARGPLCSFCECIVNGVNSISASPAESSNNIYENICENCAQFYSGNEEDCQCRKKKEKDVVVSFRETETELIESVSSLAKVTSVECLSENKEQKVKIRKTKSFNKANKPKLLSNFWDTWRKNKTTPRKPLEIVHNVEGYEQVFHTKETFDLKRICELKRSATSCSDQHIYGRLKQRDLVRSQEDFLSTQSLTNNETQLGGKRRRRISKPKFLRSYSTHEEDDDRSTPLDTTPLGDSLPSLQAVYLNNSVCQWMNSLRHDINNPSVNTCILPLSDEESGEGECYPKSIPPAKKLLALTSCKLKSTAPLRAVTNNENIYQENNVTLQTPPALSSSSSSSILSKRPSQESVATDTDSWDSTEMVKLRIQHRITESTKITGTEKRNCAGEVEEQQQVATYRPKDHYQQMVDEFKLHLLNKQAKQQQYPHLHYTNNSMASSTPAGVNNSDSNSNNKHSTNNMAKSQHSSAHTHVDIPLRQATSNHNRAKRQGMYLRLGEPHDALQNTNLNNSTEHLDLPQKQKLLTTNHDDDDDEDPNNNNNSHSNHSQREQKRLIEILNNSLNYKAGDDNAVDLSTVKSYNSELHSNQESRPELLICSDLLSCTPNQTTNASSALTTTHKRSGMHERDILQAFEALLEQEAQQQQTQLTKATTSDDGKVSRESQNNTDNNNTTITTTSQLIDPAQLPPFGYRLVKDKHTLTLAPTSVVFVDLLDLIERLQLSCSLNRIVIRYDSNDKQLFVFLRYISRYGEKYKHATQAQLVRKYQRFLRHNRCRDREQLFHSTLRRSGSQTMANSVNLKLDLMKTNGNLYGRIVVRSSEILASKSDSCIEEGKITEIPQIKTVTLQTNNNITITEANNNRKAKTPPEVPKRDPKTKLSPSTEQAPPIAKPRTSLVSKMTVPSNSLLKETQTTATNEESIYQPIWKCKTVGDVPEHLKSDEDYYDLKELQREGGKALHCTATGPESSVTDIPEILISEEDHSEWEPDEEFVFTTRPLSSPQRTESLNIHDRNGTIRSNRSQDSSIGSMSLSGSTITDFASSTATLASCASSSLMHHLFRNIGIFYSLSEPKLRAIIYDYDRIHSSKYFAKPPVLNNVTHTSSTGDNNDSGLGKSPTPSAKSQHHHQQQQQQQQQQRSPVLLKPKGNASNSSESVKSSSPSTSPTPKAKAGVAVPSAVANSSDLSPSVRAWQLQLLNINCMEDEEDMIVSESEIVRAQQIKDDVELGQPTQPQQFIQRFKSRSTDNILELPEEDDKKTIAERMRSRLQRGILNINNKSSPKSEKKLYKALRNSQTTSLYLEDGLKPKNPIFGASLDKLELNKTTCPNVPRFIVDSIEYIERKDRIVQDGLYRACGNKFSIDELKQKLTQSYIYDPKLIVADDIHTITSLLKQFFRELPHPLIPQETYIRLSRDLLKINEGIETFRIAVNEIPEPNKSTLEFLIKHLTNVAACSSSNRMNASNLAIVWGPSLFTLNEGEMCDFGRMNTLTKVLIENYDRIFHTNERLL